MIRLRNDSDPGVCEDPRHRGPRRKAEYVVETHNDVYALCAVCAEKVDRATDQLSSAITDAEYRV